MQETKTSPRDRERKDREGVNGAERFRIEAVLKGGKDGGLEDKYDPS